MLHFSGSKRAVSRECDTRDLCVAHVHWTPGFLPFGRQLRSFTGRSGVEIQHTVFQILF
jgi:hypothetical protein